MINLHYSESELIKKLAFFAKTLKTVCEGSVRSIKIGEDFS